MAYSVGQISTGSASGSTTSINYNNGSAAISGDYYLFFFGIDGNEVELRNASAQSITNDGWEEIANVNEGTVTLFCYGKVLNATDTSFTVYHSSENTRYCMFRISSGGFSFGTHLPTIHLRDSTTGDGTNAYFASRRGLTGDGIAFQAVAVDRDEVTGHTGGADYTSALYAGGGGANDVGMGVLYDTDVVFDPPLASGNFTHAEDGWAACCVLFEMPHEKLYPVSDETTTDWTPSTGTDHYALIDEDEGSFSNTDYVSTATPNAIDEYDITNPVNLEGTIHGLELYWVPYGTGSISYKVGTRIPSESQAGMFWGQDSGSHTDDSWLSLWHATTYTLAQWDDVQIGLLNNIGVDVQIRAIYARVYYTPSAATGYSKEINAVSTYSEVNGVAVASISAINAVS